jgi:hypothetical protein
VAAVPGTDDAWAAADNGNVYKLSGTTVTEGRSPISTALNAIAFTSATDGWAISDKQGDIFGQSRLLHYDGAKWTSVTDTSQLNTSHLSSIAMVSATDGWAVGNNGARLHYDGKQWNSSN